MDIILDELLQYTIRDVSKFDTLNKLHKYVIENESITKLKVLKVYSNSENKNIEYISFIDTSKLIDKEIIFHPVMNSSDKKIYLVDDSFQFSTLLMIIDNIKKNLLLNNPDSDKFIKIVTIKSATSIMILNYKKYLDMKMSFDNHNFIVEEICLQTNK